MKKNPRKILIVDDERGILLLLTKQLKVAGYHVIEASNGAMALEKAKIDLPDLLIVDLMMPHVDGTQLARELKADAVTQDIPLIFITAMMGVEKDKGHEEIDIDGHFYRIFAKPLHYKRLLSTIRKTINRRENS